MDYLVQNLESMGLGQNWTDSLNMPFDGSQSFLNIGQQRRVMLVCHISIIKCLYAIYLMNRVVTEVPATVLGTSTLLWYIWASNAFNCFFLIPLWYIIILCHYRIKKIWLAFFFLSMSVVNLVVCEFVLDVFIIISLPWMMRKLPTVLRDIYNSDFFTGYKWINMAIAVAVFAVVKPPNADFFVFAIIICMAFVISSSIRSHMALLYFSGYAAAIYSRMYFNYKFQLSAEQKQARVLVQ